MAGVVEAATSVEVGFERPSQLCRHAASIAVSTAAEARSDQVEFLKELLSEGRIVG